MSTFFSLSARFRRMNLNFTQKCDINREIARFFVVESASRRCSEDLIEP